MNKIKTDLGYKVLLADYELLNLKKKRTFLFDFAVESNLIEGIKYDPIKTRNVGDFKIEPEVWGHYRALKHVTRNYCKKNINSEEIKYMHSVLMKDLLNNAGTYRKNKMYVGGKGKPYTIQISKLMKTLDDKFNNLEEKKHKTFKEIIKLHNMFEVIHPFSDGNGRTGRLILNWLSLRYLNEFHIIESEKRSDYYKQIKEYELLFKKENPNIKFYKDMKQKSEERIFLEKYMQLSKFANPNTFKE